MVPVRTSLTWHWANGIGLVSLSLSFSFLPPLVGPLWTDLCRNGHLKLPYVGTRTSWLPGRVWLLGLGLQSGVLIPGREVIAVCVNLTVATGLDRTGEAA